MSTPFESAPAALPPQAEAEGLRAYEQVRAFESLRRQRIPLMYCGLTLLLVAFGGASWRMAHPGIAVAGLGAAVLFAVMAWFHWRRLGELHAENLRLLAELKSKYGENLPWLEVERHLAALEKLQAELAEEKRREDAAASDGGETK